MQNTVDFSGVATRPGSMSLRCWLSPRRERATHSSLSAVRFMTTVMITNVTFCVLWYCWSRGHSRSLSTSRPRRRRRSRTPPCLGVCLPRCARRIAIARAPFASWRPQGAPTCRTGNVRHTLGKDRSLPVRAGRLRFAPSVCATVRRGSWPQGCGAASSLPARAPACWAARVPQDWAAAAARAAPCARSSRGRSTRPSSTTGGGTRRVTSLAGHILHPSRCEPARAAKRDEEV